MCVDPVTMVMMGVSVAKSVVSFAADTADYNNQAAQWKQNIVNAQASARDEQSQLQLRMIQEEDAYHQADHQSLVEGAEIAAEAEASAGAAGLSGVSLDNILLGINRRITAKRYADKVNYENTSVQLTKELENTNNTMMNRINSVSKPTKPNPLGYALDAAGSVMGKMPT